MRVHHMGYLVKRIDRAREAFENIGFSPKGNVIYDAIRGVDIQFVENGGGYTIELVSPKSKDSVVAGLIRTYKNTPYHVCFETNNMEADIQKLKMKRFIQMDDPTPAPAMEGKRVCFLMNAQIGIIELVESKGI